MELKDPKLFRQQCYINGEWVDALNRGTIPVTNPATDETLGTVPRMGAEETRQAIEAANRALPGWRAKTAKERAQVLRKWFDLMMANQDDLATLMTAEQGKPLAESKGEIAYAAAFIEWFGGEMTSNPIVRKLTFTGSTEVGKLLMEQCAGTVKKLSLELGGNAPFIVFDDADIEMAVKGAIASKYRNAGQTCVCANRILVQDGVYDAFGCGDRAADRHEGGREGRGAHRRRDQQGRQGGHRRQAGR